MARPTAVPAQLGRYRILSKVGEGAMGAVYLAEDTQLRRRVALKVPHFAPDEAPRVIERFYREARVAAQLDHPNICPVFDVGEAGGIHYLTMPFIEGTALSRLVDEDNPWEPRQACELVRKLALALGEMHQKGLIHRDLKPGNILLKNNGEPVITDFGLARSYSSDSQQMTKLGTRVGTPAYMAPEQVKGEVDTLDPATDIYALGVILFQLLTGTTPYGGPLVSVYGQILHAPPPAPSARRPGIDPRLDALCQSAMAKDPRDRPATAFAFAGQLDAVLGTTTATLPPPLPPTVAGKAAPTHPTQAGAIVCPNCGARLKMPATPAARRARCPACQTVLALAAETQTDLSPARTVPPDPPVTSGGPARRRRRRERNLLPLALAITFGSLLVVAVGGFLLGRLILGGSPDKIAGGGNGGNGDDVENGRPADVKNSIGMGFVKIAPGWFWMGSPDDEGGRSADEFRHRVDITSGYHLGAHEVTQAQYARVMGRNPANFKDGPKGGPDHPVENVTWLEAKEFCEKLSALPEERAAGRVYRLPTEAEWEYACRAGTAGPFHYGPALSSDKANLDGTQPYGGAPMGPARGHTLPVGSFAPNGWGLHDMHGNVWEWCADWYDADYYAASPRRDPPGPPSGKGHVIRGGAWERPARSCRSAYRGYNDQNFSDSTLGFRVVLEAKGG